MAIYTFAYAEIPLPASDPFPAGQIAHRPLLIAHLRVPAIGASFYCRALPDSGADQCVFPLSFAGPLGLDQLKMKMHMTGGVGSAANATYYEQLEINIPFDDGSRLTFTTYAGFTAGLDSQGIGLLGQSGFFDTFRVMFDHKAKLFYVEELPPPVPAAQPQIQT